VKFTTSQAATYGEIYKKNRYQISKRVTPAPKEGGPGFYLESESSILLLSLWNRSIKEWIPGDPAL